jgi:hypothetical protein
MVSTFARWGMLACAIFIAAGAANAQAVDGYKPPSAAKQSARDAQDAPDAPKSHGTTGGGGQKVLAAGSGAAQKTIGLISIIGDTFTVKSVGITVFGNDEQEIAIAHWRVDDNVATKVGTILKKNFRVKRIAVPAGTYKKYETTLRNVDYRERRHRLVKDFAASQKCDYYLVVAPGGSVVGSTNQGIGGLGLLRWANVLSAKENVHALSELTAYDAQLNEIRSVHGTIGEDSFFEAIKGPNLALEEPKFLPPDPKAAASDPRAKELTWNLLEQSLTLTVPKLFAVD